VADMLTDPGMVMERVRVPVTHDQHGAGE